MTPRRSCVNKFLWAEFPKLLKVKNLLSLEKLPGADIEKILRDAAIFKRERARLEGSADWSTPAAAAIVRKLVAG